MAVSLTHTTVAVGTDAGNGEIAKAQWNENHTLTAAVNNLLGTTALSTTVVEIPCTAAGRALLDDADAAAQRTTLSAAGTGVSNTFTAPQTISGLTDQYPTALTIAATSHVTSDRAAIYTGNWLFGQDVNGSGVDDFFIYDSAVSAQRLLINTSGAYSFSGSGTGSSGQALISSGSGSGPTWGTLSVSGGGTGATTLTGLVKGNGTSAMTAAVAGTDYLAPAAIGTTVQAYDADLSSIAGLAGTSGFLKKTAANTWTLDTTLQTTVDGKAPLNGVGTSGTWPIGITGTAYYTFNTTQGFNSNWNTDFTSTPAASMVSRGDTSTGSSTGGPGNTWWFQQNYRHNNASNYWGVQIAWGWEDNANRLLTRNWTAGSAGGWVEYINTNNYSNYAVVTYNNTSLNSDSRNTRGVTRLYRRDANNDYSVQTYYTGGGLWRLYGYNGDTAHADTHCGYADSAGAVDTTWLANWLAGRNVGSLGSYAFLRTFTLSNYTAGQLVAGSDLRYTNANGSVPAGGVAGTWMLMGNTGTANNSASSSVWLRVS